MSGATKSPKTKPAGDSAAQNAAGQKRAALARRLEAAEAEIVRLRDNIRAVPAQLRIVQERGEAAFFKLALGLAEGLDAEKVNELFAQVDRHRCALQLGLRASALAEDILSAHKARRSFLKTELLEADISELEKRLGEHAKNEPPPDEAGGLDADMLREGWAAQGNVLRKKLDLLRTEHKVLLARAEVRDGIDPADISTWPAGLRHRSAARRWIEDDVRAPQKLADAEARDARRPFEKRAQERAEEQRRKDSEAAKHSRAALPGFIVGG